jgi:hypothetical protein
MKEENMSNINSNVYGLFGWEVREARPNCDPFTNDLRTYEGGDQVYTSAEHVKYHWRRGIQSVGTQFVEANKAFVFYEKNGYSFEKRLAFLRSSFGIQTVTVTAPEEGEEKTKGKKKAKAKKKEVIKLAEGAKDVWCYCLDIPLLGHTHPEKDNHFNMVNAVNFLYRPATFHSCRLLPVPTNNAFPSGDNDSAGSHTTIYLEYGFFLGLFELNLPTLLANTKEHQLLPGSKPDAWIKLMIDGLWEAYTNKRGTSVSQRRQKANFLLAWKPQKAAEDIDLMLLNPGEILNPLPKISDPRTARQKLKEVLPDYLEKLGFTPKGLIAVKGLKNENGVFKIPAERTERLVA